MTKFKNLLLSIIIGLSAAIIAVAFNNPTGNPVVGTGAIIGIGTGALANSIYVNSSSNVGVGTTAPGAKLEVKDGFFKINSAASAVSYMSFVVNGNYANTVLGIAGAANDIWTGTAAGDLGIRSDGNQKIFLGPTTGGPTATISGGSVGIGATNPGTFTNGDPGVKLEISGGDVLIGKDAAGGDYFTKSVPQHVPGYDGETGISYHGYYSGVFVVHGPGNGAFTDEYVVFRTHRGGSSQGERMRIDAFGNVGIGTTNPGNYRLDVVGGKFRAAANTYDSGWFAVTTNTNYTRVHNLNTTQVLVQIYFSNASDGNGFVTILGDDNINYNIGAYGTSMTALSGAQITIRTGASGIFNGIDASGANYYPSSGYIKIVMLALE